MKWVVSLEILSERWSIVIVWLAVRKSIRNFQYSTVKKYYWITMNNVFWHNWCGANTELNMRTKSMRDGGRVMICGMRNPFSHFLKREQGDGRYRWDHCVMAFSPFRAGRIWTIVIRRMVRLKAVFARLSTRWVVYSLVRTKLVTMKAFVKRVYIWLTKEY